MEESKAKWKGKKSLPLVTPDLIVGLTFYDSAASSQSAVTAGDTLWMFDSFSLLYFRDLVRLQLKTIGHVTIFLPPPELQHHPQVQHRLRGHPPTDPEDGEFYALYRRRRPRFSATARRLAFNVPSLSEGILVVA